MGRMLILAGLVLVAAGAILQFAPALLNWFGRLPGDIHIENERSKIFIPITSMLLVSIILSLLFRIIKR